MTQQYRNYPPSNVAKKSDMPLKRHEVESVLSNLYGHNRDSLGDSPPSYYIFEQKAYYKGSWKNQYPDGKGICMYEDGSYYEGNFEMGEAVDNKAIFIFPNGALYEG